MEFTKEKIEALKKAHGEIILLEVEGKSCIIKKPSRHVVGLALANSRKDPLAGAETILANCWVEGDAEMKEDVGCLVSLAGQMDNIIGVVTAEVKKL
jgi:hypothetical protein